MLSICVNNDLYGRSDCIANIEKILIIHNATVCHRWQQIRSKVFNSLQVGS